MPSTPPTKKDALDPRHLAREYAFQFLYQSEMERIFYFSKSHFAGFLAHHQVDNSLHPKIQLLAETVLNDLAEIDQMITDHLQHWSLERLATVERSILRLAVAELRLASEPSKVIMNEAVELAKTFGTADSHKIVNGLLSRMHQTMLKSKA